MYIVLEMQTNGGTTAIAPAQTFASKNQADAAYHQILAAAAVSNIEKHAAIIMDERGVMYDNKCYFHDTPPEPEE